MPSFLVYVVATVAVVFGALALVKGPREAWRLWRRFGHAMGDALARVVLTVFYFTVMIPFALIARRQDALGLGAAGGPRWGAVAVPAAGDGRAAGDAARRQF